MTSYVQTPSVGSDMDRDRRRLLSTIGVGAAGFVGCVADDDPGPPSEDTTGEPTASPTTNTTVRGTTDAEGTTAGTPGTPAALTNPSFESDLDGWTVGTHLPEDPNETTGTVDASAETTDRAASDGERALSLYVEGTQDDGTIWVQQPVDLSGVSTLSVDYEVTESFNVRSKAAVYAGPAPEDALVEADFDTSNAIDGHDASGWKTFEYDVSHDGVGVVAVGVTVVWETEITNRLDAVRLD